MPFYGPMQGKKRTVEELSSIRGSSSLSLPISVKKPKRAETKPCPVCNESIPIRLLHVHSELEMERVEDIVRNIGSTEVMVDEFEEGSSSRGRRSAIRARKSLSAMSQRAGSADTLERTSKTIQTIKRHRKQRHSKLREMTREGEDREGTWIASAVDSRDETLCPVCSQTVRGDQDVMEAHVDACLAHQSRRSQEENDRAIREDAWEDVDIDSETTLRVTDATNLRAMGFHVRNRNEEDVDDEVDVDGDDDEAVFGDAQFNEGDVLTLGSGQPIGEDQELEVEIDSDGDGDEETDTQHKSLRDLVAEGKVVRRSTEEDNSMKTKAEDTKNREPESIDLAIAMARKLRNSSALISALENKIKQLESIQLPESSPAALLCRICIDPYTEPTVSTGCWHTCCRDCWLRCLGTTKLCPICKRITAATELRRIYI